MIKFLANENFPKPSIKLLREAGYDISSVIEESPGEKDDKILEKATLEKRIILTFDRDYGELIYKYNMPHSTGVIFFRFDPLTPKEPAQILLGILTIAKLNLENYFTVVERDKIRQRNLPGITKK